MSDLIRCPACGSTVPENARFCPGCDAPRSHVELELRRASELTGISYAELLDRAIREDQPRKETPFTGDAGTAVEPGVSLPASDDRPGWHKVLFLFLGVAVVTLVFGSAAGGLLGSNTGSSSASRNDPVAGASSTYRVEYRVTMTNSLEMSLTYANAQGGTEQKRTYATNGGWTETFNMRPGSHAYISAQNLKSSGGVKCEIYVDGRLWRTSESTGGYTIATCSGSVGRE